MQNVSEEFLLFGNGASELFMAVVHALKPKKTVITNPSFTDMSMPPAAGTGRLFTGRLGGKMDFV